MPSDLPGYDDTLLSKIVPHYTTITLTHAMPMSELGTFFRHLEDQCNIQVNYYSTKIEAYKYTESSDNQDLKNHELNESIRLSERKPWIINSRKIVISNFKDFDATLRLHRCSSLIITPKTITIRSTYKPDKIANRLTKFFKSISNAESITATSIDIVELKMCVPLEFATKERLNSISSARDLPENRKRNMVKNIFFSAGIDFGVEIECYQLVGKKAWPTNWKGSTYTHTCYIDKTFRLFVVPLEFRFDLTSIRSVLGIISVSRFEYIVKKLKRHLIEEYLLDEDCQMRIPLLTIPEPWVNAPRQPRYQQNETEVELERRKRMIKLRDAMLQGESMGYCIKEFNKISKMKPRNIKRPYNYGWDETNYQTSLSRVEYIHEMLDQPYYKKILKEWINKKSFYYGINWITGLQEGSD